jgi:peptidoglycan/xylan/chitin deacetylase (PgdA/CDA1 family)
MGKKEILANLLYYSGLLRPAARLARNSVLILTYHRLRQDGPRLANSEIFDQEVFGPSQHEFERQIKWLRGDFDVLSEGELLGVLKEQRSYKNRFAAITFDDGYADNYELAYPVLRALSVPAIFFVCPGLLNSRRVGWWDAIAYLIKKSHRSFITIRGTNFPMGSEKSLAIRELTTWMKLRSARETTDLVPELAQACDVELPDPSLQDRQFMTWEQLREVSQNGIAIGSHTYSHPVLATLDESLQEWELKESKRALEAQLRRPVRTLAYPVGGYEHFTPQTMRIAKDAGYECAFSAQTGYNQPGAYPYNIRRIVCRDSFDPLFACSTLFPRVFSWLRPIPASHQIGVL